MRFGQLEIRTIATLLLSRFTLSLPEDFHLAIRQMPTISPKQRPADDRPRARRAPPATCPQRPDGFEPQDSSHTSRCLSAGSPDRQPVAAPADGLARSRPRLRRTRAARRTASASVLPAGSPSGCTTSLPSLCAPRPRRTDALTPNRPPLDAAPAPGRRRCAGAARRTLRRSAVFTSAREVHAAPASASPCLCRLASLQLQRTLLHAFGASRRMLAHPARFPEQLRRLRRAQLQAPRLHLHRVRASPQQLHRGPCLHGDALHGPVLLHARARPCSRRSAAGRAAPARARARSHPPTAACDSAGCLPTRTASQAAPARARLPASLRVAGPGARSSVGSEHLVYTEGVARSSRAAPILPPESAPRLHRR